VEAIYIPADDLADPAVQEIQSQLDSMIVLSRAKAEEGIRPAVDLVQTTSSLLTPDIVGQRHYALATEVQAILGKYEVLKGIVNIVGQNELSPQDRADFRRGGELIEFFSQNLFVTELLTGNPSEYYTREQTLNALGGILM